MPKTMNEKTGKIYSSASFSQKIVVNNIRDAFDVNHFTS